VPLRSGVRHHISQLFGSCLGGLCVCPAGDVGVGCCARRYPSEVRVAQPNTPSLSGCQRRARAVADGLPFVLGNHRDAFCRYLELATTL
jgi:hypothetical protein